MDASSANQTTRNHSPHCLLRHIPALCDCRNLVELLTGIAVIFSISCQYYTQIRTHLSQALYFQTKTVASLAKGHDFL